MTNFQNINDQNNKSTYKAYLSMNLEATGFGHWAFEFGIYPS